MAIDSMADTGGRPGDDGFDEDGYDESQRAEILETLGDGPGDGTIQTDLAPDLGGAAPGDDDDDNDDDADDEDDGDDGEDESDDDDGDDVDDDLDDDDDLSDPDSVALKP